MPAFVRVAGAIALSWPAASAATLEWTSFASGQQSYDSNVFSVSSQTQAADRDGDARRDDTVLQSAAGLNAGYLFSGQKVHASVEGRQLDYERFSELDHEEYVWSGGLDWRASTAADGTFVAREERRMASFAARRTTELTLEEDRTMSTGVNLNVTPQWRVETGAKVYELDSPLPGFPEFTVREVSGTVGVKYATTPDWASGFEAEYLDGRFGGVPDAPTFHKVAAHLTSDYGIDRFSRLNAELGYSRLAGNDSEVAGFSGLIGGSRALSGVTEVNARVFRRVQGYLAGANAIVDTGAGAGFKWQPWLSVAVDGSYVWTRSRFQALAPEGSAENGRIDRLQDATLGLAYQAWNWLGLRTFGIYRVRKSTSAVDTFDQSIAGIELRANWR